MSRLNILSFSEQKELDNPREFTGDERKYSKMANILDYLFDIIEKIGEHLMEDKSQYSNAGYLKY